MNENWLYLVGGGTGGSILVAAANKFFSRKSDKIDALEKIIDAQSQRMDAQDKRLTISEKKIETLEKDNSKYRKIIRTAINCIVPNAECPVLIKQDWYDKQDESNCIGCGK